MLKVTRALLVFIHFAHDFRHILAIKRPRFLILWNQNFPHDDAQCKKKIVPEEFKEFKSRAH